MAAVGIITVPVVWRVNSVVDENPATPMASKYEVSSTSFILMKYMDTS